MAFSTAPSFACIPKPASPIIRCSSAFLSTQFDLKTYWTSLIKDIDQKLNDATPVQYPHQMHESMRMGYSLLAKSSNRAPPLMCVAAFELFGGDRRAAFPTACALEMVRAASLAHTDDAPSRKDQPSNDVVFGADMAILAGDALFPLGFQHIVSHTPPDVVPPTRLIRVIAEIARAFGSQFLDVDGGGETNAFDFIQEKKFGQMGQCSAVCGGLLAGASDDELRRLRKYGQAVGVLYQVVDDINLEMKTKKDKVGNGKGKGKGRSYVSVYGVERAMEVAEDLQSQAKQELQVLENVYGGNVLLLYSFADYAADRGFTF